MIRRRSRSRSTPAYDALPALPVLIPAGLLVALFSLPLLALLLRGLDESATLALLEGAAIGAAIRLSLSTTAVSLLVIVLLGTPLAFGLARYRFPGKRLLQILVELPIVLPPVVAGLALLMAFGRRGLFGPLLSQLGISIPFTAGAIVLAQIFVASPFYVRALQSRFASIPREIEEAARIDGAGGWRTFLFVTLPLSGRAISTGLVLSWARALGEFGATILFAGNLQGRTQTMPLLVYGALDQDLGAALWSGLILVGVAALILALVHGLTRLLAGTDEADPLARW